MSVGSILEQIRKAVEIAVPALGLVNDLVDKFKAAGETLSEDDIAKLNAELEKLSPETQRMGTALSADLDAASRR